MGAVSQERITCDLCDQVVGWFDSMDEAKDKNWVELSVANNNPLLDRIEKWICPACVQAIVLGRRVR